MILGRTPEGLIKTKTDGGLRAVNCACCGPKCIPFSGSIPDFFAPISKSVGEALSAMPQMSVNFSASGTFDGNPVSMSFSGRITNQYWVQNGYGFCEFYFQGSSGDYPRTQNYSFIVIKNSNQWYINVYVNFYMYPSGYISNPPVQCPPPDGDPINVSMNLLGDTVILNACPTYGTLDSVSLSFYV